MFWAALGKMTWKMLSVLWQFCVNIGEISRTHIVFWPKYTPRLLHSVIINGVRDRSWQGGKLPCFSCLCNEIWRFTHSRNSGEKECFFIKWLPLGNLRVKAPFRDSGKGCCIDRIDRAMMVFELFWTGFGDPVVTMVVCTKKKCAIQIIHNARNT